MRDEMAVTGELPVDYMIRVMRDPTTEPHRRECDGQGCGTVSASATGRHTSQAHER
jgi:hypothetical protein